ncbi:MAG: GNAT family N-acetyltransferase [Actinomycetaceae bacterium]|nr:GNAT family N-acetyltransferase [Actinomycetaceae bacterium]MDU0970957.1 GNAT family N-acetyltransferase [Actinomycetaceae bacterium]
MADRFFRRASAADLDQIMRAIAAGKRQLQVLGADQWSFDGYPSRADVAADIDARLAHVLVEPATAPTTSDIVVASIVLDPRPDPWYDQPGLAWRTPREGTLVLHRLVVAPEYAGQGVARDVLAYAATVSPNGHMRADTSAENAPMRRVFAACGFREAGEIVYTDFGEIRCVAYER